MYLHMCTFRGWTPEARFPDLLAGPASSGRIFSVKWTFIGLTSVNFFSNDKDKILQDVSSLPFYPKTRSVDSLFRIPSFCFDRFFAEKLKHSKKLFFFQKKKKKKAPQADPLTLIQHLFFTIFFKFFARPFWAAGGGNPGN